MNSHSYTPKYFNVNSGGSINNKEYICISSLAARTEEREPNLLEFQGQCKTVPPQMTSILTENMAICPLLLADSAEGAKAAVSPSQKSSTASRCDRATYQATLFRSTYIQTLMGQHRAAKTGRVQGAPGDNAEGSTCRVPANLL